MHAGSWESTREACEWHEARVLGSLNCTTRTRVRVYRANSMEEVVGFSHPVLRRFSLTHDAARLREWAEGLVDRPDKKIKTKKCPKYLETAIFFLNISKFSKHRQMYQVLRVICYFCLSSTRNLFLLKFSGFAVGTSSVCL